MVTLMSGQTDTFHNSGAAGNISALNSGFNLAFIGVCTAIYSSNYPKLSFDQGPPLEKRHSITLKAMQLCFFWGGSGLNLTPFSDKWNKIWNYYCIEYQCG